MSILLPCSLALLAAAVALSLRIAARSGDARAALLGTALLLAGVALALALAPSRHAPLGFDLESAAAAAGLLAGALGLLAARAFGRALAELERAEALHWESMEVVRALGAAAGRSEHALEQRLTQLLDLGCAQLGLEIGIVARARGGRGEVMAIRAPAGVSLFPGASFALADSWYAATLASERPLACARASEAPRGGRPADPELRCEAYLGARVHVEGECAATLAFASLAPRAERFSATHKDLVQLMARWVGGELERDRLRRALPAASAAGKAGAPARAPARAVEAAAVFDLNLALARLERRIQRTVGPGIAVQLRLAADALRVQAPRLPLDAVVLGLVRLAAAALTRGGELRIATAEWRPPPAAPGASGARAPAGYATVSLVAHGPHVDGGALARLLEPDEDTAALDSARAPLPLSALQRLLQRAGGDLAVAVEAGRGATLTAFLPRSEAPVASARAGLSQASPPLSGPA